MRQTRTVQLTLTLSLLIAACSATSVETTTTEPPPTTASGDTAAFDLTTIVTEFVGEAPGGAIVLIERNGEAEFAAVGFADADGRSLTRETPMRVGSISKPFVATMILQMVEEGSVTLDEPIGTYLPDVPLGAEVTVRQLLSHQSGLPNYTADPTFFLAVLDDFTRSYTPEEILAFVTDDDPQPTGTFEYSNTNYILLGMLIEQIDGLSLNESLQKRITGPFGMDNTLFAGRGVAEPEGLASFWSFGVNSGELGVGYESVASAAWAAGSLVSTVDDLASFLRLLFGGDILPAAPLAEMTKTGTFGYGLGLYAALLGADNPGFAHNGSIPGFSSSMGMAPASGDMVVVLTNNDLLIADQLAEKIVTNW